MCLIANKENPLKGKTSLKFDEKGYTTCWKVYQKIEDKFRTLFYGLSDSIAPGDIKSDRKSKEICVEERDIFRSLGVDIAHGIHVYIDLKWAFDRKKAYDTYEKGEYTVVPVRCHNQDLIAVDNYGSEAVFMKVFLKNSDYQKALKG